MNECLHKKFQSNLESSIRKEIASSECKIKPRIPKRLKLANI